MIDQLKPWGGDLINELDEADYDFGVSVGAVNYAMAMEGKAIRIRSGYQSQLFL